ncbi:ATP synthase subunit I [Alteromonas sp. ASW11-36]|uniref:ATP synthase subunit I n=1 Tax=Alteromonas arenosi TaxID=3055817 RepID=A0ABT7ST07_9ALTE|nr:ATP synthase subunit I [Alteromonas sp. ASW11-36]MDM7859330.1 ATP synthase subunit I [Alteromonas sp. ASW11-36]
MPSNDLVADGKALAKVGFFVQLGVTVVLAAAAATATDLNGVISVLLGCFASVVPNGIFAFFAFRFSGAQQAKAVATSLMQGARYKLGLAALIFGIAFIAFEAQPVLLFCAFAIATISYWLTMFRVSQSS